MENAARAARLLAPATALSVALSAAAGLGSATAQELTPDNEPAFTTTTDTTLEPAPAPAPLPAPTPATVPGLAFNIASFNVLGANHTYGRGGHGPGFTRGKMAAGLVRKHKVDVVGFQEMQMDNWAGFRKVLPESKFSFYPGPRRFEELDNENSIAWKNAKFRLVSARTMKIPYFHGQPRRMPLVLLEHRRTGRRLFVANFHNPASTRRHGNNERWRDRATRMEIALVRKLVRKFDHPVFFTGDFNEHREYFCRLTGATQMASASGGSTSGPCRVPKPTAVDLIFGSSRKGVDFAWFRRDESRQVRRTTDHPLIVARSIVRSRPAG